MSLDDRQLLLGIARGRDDCARELWNRHGVALSALARVIVGPSASSDVVQSALCRILQSPISRLQTVEHVPAWLAALVRHEAANHLRSERRRRARDRNHFPMARQSPSASSSPGPGSLWQQVDALPRRLREIIVLKLVAGMTFDQLSLALGLNRNTAAARYRSAIDSLRKSASPQDRALSAGGVGHAP